MSSVFKLLPTIRKPLIFTSLDNTCYCGALFSIIYFLDFTISPLQTFEDLCFEDESKWQKFTYKYVIAMKSLAFFLIIVSIGLIWGIKAKEFRLLLAFMYVASINVIGLIIYILLLFFTNIIDSMDECDFPYITYRDVFMRTILKMITALCFSCIYIYMVIAAKSFYFENISAKPKPRRKLEQGIIIKDSPISTLPTIQEI